MDPATAAIAMQAAGMAGSGGGGGGAPVNPYAIALQGGLAVGQLYQAHRLKKQLGERPELTTPESVAKATELASAQRFAELPGQAEAREAQAAITAAQISAAQQMGQSPTQALATVQQAGEAERRAQQQLDIQGQQYRDQKTADYIRALQTTGQYEREQQMYNVIQPYEEKAAAIQALQGAAIQNIGQMAGGMGGMGGGQPTGTAGPTEQQLAQFYSQYGVGGAGTTPAGGYR